MCGRTEGGAVLKRYASPAMRKVWSDETRYERWRRVELAVLEARVATGRTPPTVLTFFRDRPTPPVAAIEALEAEVRHDVVAFLYAWTDGVDPAIAGHVHQDLTSSDVVDTGLSLAIGQAATLTVHAAEALVVALCTQALAHRDTVCLARTHGQAAAPTVFGYRLADFAFAADRAVQRLEAATDQAMLTNITGPVGTGVGLGPNLTQHVASVLQLTVPPVTTQVLFRDHIAAWVAALALLAAVCEAVATDVRIGQHDGVAEVAESRGARQQGSSAMPHKRNPIRAEQICGLARVVRGYVGPALEDIALWQQRDISHSSVERVILPDGAALTEYLCATTADLIMDLTVDRSAMTANLQRAGELAASSRELSVRLAGGVPRRVAVSELRHRSRPVKSGEGAEVQPRHSALDAAIEEMSASPALAACFDQVEQLSRRYRDRTGRWVDDARDGGAGRRGGALVKADLRVGQQGDDDSAETDGGERR